MQKQTILAVDLGGTKVLLGEVDHTGHVLTREKVASDVSSQAAATQLLLKQIEHYFKHHDTSHIQAIALDVVGRVNSATGVWEEIDPADPHPIALSQQVQDQFHLPCFIGNDVMVGTIAENLLGIGTVTKSFIYLAIGTGIAGRIVLNGQLVNGPDYDAGEFGHMVVDQTSTVQCVCGRYGCVEPLASGLGMSDRTHELYPQYMGKTQLQITPGQRIGTETLFAAYDAGDPLAKRVVDQALLGLANLIMNLTRALNPEAIRLGGGVTTGGWLVAHLQPLLKPLTMRFVREGVKNTALEPNSVALQGCGLYGFERLEGSEQHG